MSVVVDTSVWSLFLRRAQPPEVWQVGALESLIQERRVQMLGIIRQELLSGIRETAQFSRLAQLLAGFPDLLATTSDHVLAAQCFNRCRSRGVQGSYVDFLICAQAIHYEFSILSTDADFIRYAEHLPITLYPERLN